MTGPQDGDSISLIAPDAYGVNDNLIYQPPTFTDLLDNFGLGFVKNTTGQASFHPAINGERLHRVLIDCDCVHRRRHRG